MTKTEAVEHFKTATALAAAIGRSKTTVSGYGEKLPRGVQYEVHVKTQGQLLVDIDYH